MLPQILVCAQICSAVQVRCFQLSTDGAAQAILREAASTDCAGVFDFKWCPRNHQACAEHDSAAAAVALADGTCALMHMPKDPAGSIEQSMPAVSSPGAAMCVYCDWLQVASADELVTAHADGSVQHLAVREDSIITKRAWQAHSMEAWVAAADLHHVRSRQGCAVQRASEFALPQTAVVHFVGTRI